MLVEVTDVQQVPGDPRRRWFMDEYFDLIVWYAGESISGFQLCYDKTIKERALTWHGVKGFSHERIDDGEIPGRYKMTPVLVPDGQFDSEQIASRFRRESSAIDPGVARFVLEVLSQYPGARGRPKS
jgi:hypothetical protein